MRQAHDNYDKGEHIKEVFAYFGRAYYTANLFETGLAIALKREGVHSLDRYETEFDTFMKKQHAQTLGNLLKRFEKHNTADTKLKTMLAEAKDKRDFIAHHYFRERAEEFATRVGRDSMIAELDASTTVFDEADEAIQAVVAPRLASIGVSVEHMESHIKRYVESFDTDD